VIPLNLIPWKLVGIVVGCAMLALGALYIVGIIKENGSLKVQLDNAIEVANSNAENLRLERIEHQRIETITTEVVTNKTQNRKKADTVRKEIVNAPPTDDGPIAPVLRRQLDRLRPHEDSNQDRANPAAGSPGATPRPVP